MSNNLVLFKQKKTFKVFKPSTILKALLQNSFFFCILYTVSNFDPERRPTNIVLKILFLFNFLILYTLHSLKDANFYRR